MKTILTAGLFLASAFMGAGCRANTNSPNAAGSITEDEYIEVIAQWNLIHGSYQEQINEAMAEGDSDRIIELQEDFALEATQLLEEMDIDPENLAKFEEDNAEFLENPENQQRVIERIEELMMERQE